MYRHGEWQVAPAAYRCRKHHEVLVVSRFNTPNSVSVISAGTVDYIVAATAGSLACPAQVLEYLTQSFVFAAINGTLLRCGNGCSSDYVALHLGDLISSSAAWKRNQEVVGPMIWDTGLLTQDRQFLFGVMDPNCDVSTSRPNPYFLKIYTTMSLWSAVQKLQCEPVHPHRIPENAHVDRLSLFLQRNSLRARSLSIDWSVVEMAFVPETQPSYQHVVARYCERVLGRPDAVSRHDQALVAKAATNIAMSLAAARGRAYTGVRIWKRTCNGIDLMIPAFRDETISPATCSGGIVLRYHPSAVKYTVATVLSPYQAKTDALFAYDPIPTWTTWLKL